MNAILTILKETLLILTPLLLIYAIPQSWLGLLIAIILLTASLRQAIRAISGPKGSVYHGAGVGIVINSVLIAILVGLWPPVWARIPAWCLILGLFYNSYRILRQNSSPFFLWIK